MTDPADLATHLESARNGDAAALNVLLPLVYAELRQIARRQLAAEPQAITLQTTALVNEAYLRLAGQRSADWSSRAYFFGLAATVMRRILVDHFRDKRRLKRDGGAPHLTLSAAEDQEAEGASVDVLRLHDALETLEGLDARLARVVELKFFGGLEETEIAAALGLSPATVRRDWRTARLWLGRELAA